MINYDKIRECRVKMAMNADGGFRLSVFAINELLGKQQYITECKVLINISTKFQTIQSGDCRTCLKRHINPINGDVLLNCHTAPSLRFHRCCGCFTTLYSGSQIWHIYRLVPILINLGIRFLTGFSFYQTTV